MIHEIKTLREADAAIQELIDSFEDAIFIEACEAMESAAETALMARREELDSE